MRSTEDNSEKVVSGSGVANVSKPRFETLRRILSLVLVMGGGVATILADGQFRTVLTIVFLLSFTLSTVKKLIRKSEPSAKATKDKSLQWILFIAALVLPPDSREAALGDMLERYKHHTKLLGSKKMAKCAMFADIFRSAYPMLKYLTRSIVIRILKLIGLYEIYRRFIG